MPATWPETLPHCPPLGGDSEQMADGRRVSSTDTGPGKVWRRSSAMARPLTITLRMSRDQLNDFEEFVHDDLADGSLPFQFPALRGEGEWLVRIRPGEMPSWSRVSGSVYAVSLPLEILP